MDNYILRDVVVLDESGRFAGPVDVAVESGRVVGVGPNQRLNNAPSFDFSGLWLMPGMFDCHLHVTASSLSAMELMHTPITRWTLETAQNLRRTLEGGVTFVRDAAGADAGIRDSIERGYVPGPQLRVAVTALCQTGGHIDGYLAGPGLEMSADYVLPDYPNRPPYRVDGVDEMRKAVRATLRAGADWIKLCTTGGILSAHDEGDAPEFTPEEIGVAVYEARRKGKGVMVHAFGGEGLTNSVKAGVASIEHGSLMTEEHATLMSEAGCWLVPTLAVIRDVFIWAADGRLPPYATRKALALKARVGHAVSMAHEHGVKIALGTDYVSREQHGRNLEEIALARQAGLEPHEALLAATTRGAELCGVSDRYGRIAAGYVFDAIILEEDPSDTTIFTRPGAARGVFKAGVPSVRHPRLGEHQPRAAVSPG
jgi:imidazolonepropionase-like amidohydrolase